ncbi:MAG TPA: S-adenosylmethionine:tRNA ribosyltransferase-isomerase [Actinomycetales bacterium]|nr:S-adenosylmethionine:tRNA ribosyltransferase-isomerase [Actinomycetales bacterium]
MTSCRPEVAAPEPPTTTFVLPPGSDAPSPPEHRGVARDGVRLLAVRPSGTSHRVFRDLPALLNPGDLLVVNTSATLAAALTARGPHGQALPLHVSAVLDDGSWVVEPRLAGSTGPDLRGRRGDVLRLPDGVRAVLADTYPEAGRTCARLWRAQVTPATDLVDYLGRHGRPIQYSYLDASYDLASRQTAYAMQPGSAEMPSAGRPFTPELLVRLMAAGVTLAPVLLHCGVSSPEAHEPPTPEKFEVPADTARLVRSATGAGRRVIAVGTTVVRALESAVGEDGRVRAARGWTDLVVSPRRPARAVTGLVTGLHAPEASHLLLLEAVAGAELVRSAYDEAVRERYLWHEYGDSMLFLP